MRQLMVPTLDPSIFVISISDLGWLERPALPANGRDHLVVVLETPYLGPFSVCRSIEHKGIHWSGDIALALLDLLPTDLRRSVDPLFHISDWNMRIIFGQLAQRSRDPRRPGFLFLQRTYRFLGWRGFDHPATVLGYATSS